MHIQYQRKRADILFLTCALLLLFGVMYAWSIFVLPLEEEFGWTRSQTSLVFTLSMIFFSVGNMASSFLLKKGMRFTLLVVAAIVSISLVAASRIDTPAGLYASYGVGWSTGVGIGYNALLDNSSRWFPDKPGFVSGVALTSYGLGGLVVGSLVTWLLSLAGWRDVFLWLGVLLGGVTLIGAFVAVPPPKGAVLPAAEKANCNGAQKGSFTTKQMLSRPVFWCGYIWCFALIMGGTMFIGNASPIALSQGAPVMLASLLVGILSFTNGFSRFVFGMLCDKLAYRKMMLLVGGLFLAAIVLLFLSFQAGSLAAVSLSFVFIGLSYGGALTCSIVIVRDYYGPKHYSMNLSVILTVAIPASLCGPTAAAAIHMQTGSYEGIIPILLVLCALAFVLPFFIKRPDRPGA